VKKFKKMNEQRGRSRTPKTKENRNRSVSSNRSRSVRRNRDSFRNQNNDNNNRKLDTQTNLSKTTQYSYPKGIMKGNSFRVSKREFLQNVIPQDPFSPIKIDFNPGISSSFPWLSGVAPNFEKYVVNKLRLCYETAQSTFVPGMVMIAPEFNVTDGLPINKTELLEYAYAARSPVWKSFSIDIKKESIMNFRDYYVRVTDVTDKRIFDPLYIIVATDAVSTDLSYCGEIWVEYDIEFTLPQIIRKPDPLVLGYKQIILGLTTNDVPFANLISETGLLKVSTNGSNTILFDEEFTGLIYVLIDAVNVGAQTKLSANPPNWVNLSLSGNITIVSSIGGSGSAQDDNGYTTTVVYCQSIPKGGSIQINNLGYYTNGGLTAVGCTFKFNRGLW